MLEGGAGGLAGAAGAAAAGDGDAAGAAAAGGAGVTGGTGSGRSGVDSLPPVAFGASTLAVVSGLSSAGLTSAGLTSAGLTSAGLASAGLPAALSPSPSGLDAESVLAVWLFGSSFAGSLLAASSGLPGSSTGLPCRPSLCFRSGLPSAAGTCPSGSLGRATRLPFWPG
ncbi:hypothetical protein JQ604_34560 [Bradyrhizobium jicamae]|nr:hypothetical protein [Bradyrhizobium jicamae]